MDEQNNQPAIGQIGNQQTATGQIIKKEMGRPVEWSIETERRLEEALKIGLSDKSACAYAGISRETFYKKIRENDDFSDKMQRARDYASIASRNLIVNAIIDEKTDKDKRLELSKWYLENHDLRNKTTGNVQNTQVNVFSDLKNKYSIKKEEDPAQVTEPAEIKNE